MTTYPRSVRLRSRAAFRRVVTEGDVFPGRQVLVRRCSNGKGFARLGVATPARYGSAVRRNRLRRLVREAFRQHRSALGSFDYMVSPRKHLLTPTLAGVRDDLLATQSRAPAPRRTRGG